jgi:hypothetical protein
MLHTSFEKGFVGRESFHSTLKAYNNSCAEMRSEARDAFISNSSSLSEMRIIESTLTSYNKYGDACIMLIYAAYI